MKIYLHIDGYIGEPKDKSEYPEYTTLQDLVAQFEGQKKSGDITEAHVKIDSTGGYADVGEAMYAFLKGLSCKVTTEQVGFCCSAATFPFMAGEERIASTDEAKKFMIHAPMKIEQAGNFKTSDELKDEGEKLAKYESQFAKFYADTTGSSLSAIKEFMKNDTELTPQQMVDMGFATQIKEDAPVEAIMMIREKKQPNTTTMSEITSELKKEFTNWKKEILALFPKKEKTVAEFKAEFSEKSGVAAYIDYTTSDGMMLSVNVDGEDPVGGQAVIVDDAGNFTPAEPGDYTVDNGAVLTVGENSEVTAFTPAADEMGAMKEQVTELQEMVASLKKENEALKENAGKDVAEKVQEKIKEVEKMVDAVEEEKEAMMAIRTEFRIPKDRILNRKEPGKETAADRIAAIAGGIKKNPTIKEQIA